jgi:hypothetical protein
VLLFFTALQVDFSRHALENVRIVNNLQDGLGILYSDLYSSGVANTVKNSEFNGNRGNGISFKQLGLKITGKMLQDLGCLMSMALNDTVDGTVVKCHIYLYTATFILMLSLFQGKIRQN